MGRFNSLTRDYSSIRPSPRNVFFHGLGMFWQQELGHLRASWGAGLRLKLQIEPIHCLSHNAGARDIAPGENWQTTGHGQRPHSCLSIVSIVADSGCALSQMTKPSSTRAKIKWTGGRTCYKPRLLHNQIDIMHVLLGKRSCNRKSPEAKHTFCWLGPKEQL